MTESIMAFFSGMFVGGCMVGGGIYLWNLGYESLNPRQDEHEDSFK